MKKLMLIVGLMGAAFAGRAMAEGTSPSDVSPPVMTPEMWYYQQQMQQYDDPKAAVRRKAEFRARQRQARLAAQKWFGYSKLRPPANSTPYGVTYSPRWIGNSRYPFSWSGSSTPAVVIVPQEVDRR